MIRSGIGSLGPGHCQVESLNVVQLGDVLEEDAKNAPVIPRMVFEFPRFFQPFGQYSESLVGQKELCLATDQHLDKFKRLGHGQDDVVETR